MRASAKARAKRDRVARVRAQLRVILYEERGPDCECGRECGQTWTDLHEVLPRGRGGSPTDPENIKLLHFECHRWVHDNPARAKRRGLTR